MPSTYTQNSGIEKPGIGEQTNTWGSTANDNYDIIDRSINGVGSLSLSGTSSTLTTSDGSLSDGHYKVLVLGGSPSGTHTITISPNDADKLYFVYNNSGQSVVFTQGSGGNVTIANGDSAIVYANGGGAGAAVAKFTPDNLADLTVTGTLAVDDITPSATLAVTGAVTVSTTLDVTGNTTVGGTFDATGATTLGSTLDVTGNTTVGGTLGVTGTLTADGVANIGGNLNLTGAFSIGGNAAYALGDVDILTSGTAATYTTPSGARALRVRAVGGGGGGGGVDGQTASDAGVSSGGSGGGYFELWITSPEATYTYTIGAGGAGGAAGNNDGASGGNTTWAGASSTATANGGVGGGGHTATGGTSGGSSRNGGSASIGTFTTGIAIRGGASGWGRVVGGNLATLPLSGASMLSGTVDSSPYTSGGIDNTIGYGGGGGSVYVSAVSNNGAGGDGGDGVIIVEVFY